MAEFFIGGRFIVLIDITFFPHHDFRAVLHDDFKFMGGVRGEVLYNGLPVFHLIPCAENSVIPQEIGEIVASYAVQRLSVDDDLLHIVF